MLSTARSINIDKTSNADCIRSAQIRSAYNYWVSICDGTNFPSRKDIDPVNIKTLLPYVMLIDVPENYHKMKIRLLGNAIIDFLDYNPTGELLVEHLQGDDSNHLLEGYHQVILDKNCHYLEDALFTGSSDSIKYHRLICPLASDGENIDCLFGAVCFDRLSSGQITT